jgi:hypothetical protein
VAPSVGLVSKLTAKLTKPSYPTETNEYFTVKFNQSILFASESDE